MKYVDIKLSLVGKIAPVYFMDIHCIQMSLICSLFQMKCIYDK